MKKIAIVTDSTAYLPREMREQHQIEVVSLILNFEGESYPEEGLYDNFGEFYQRLRQVSYLPTTSQPPVGEFLKVYQRLANDYESIISIHITEGISGTVQSARAAAAMLPNADIHVVDSRAAAVGEYMVVDAAVRAVDAGFSRDEVLQVIDHVINHMTLLFMPGSLEYLHRGGRIGGAAALVGSLLQIKPLLYFNWDKNNIIDLFEKVRTKEKGIRRMFEILDKAYVNCPKLKTAVVHVDAKQEGQLLIERIKDRYPELSPDSCPVGPVVGAHIGPGTVGVCCYPLIPQLYDIIKI
ncbi:MAG: DegV family protein [Thermacetogeniaceae bacterium]|jgi:DegV family protein with EDD domain|nr:DegV family protein [Thermoanaerobacterales bacterium]NLN21430.1 DegV family protein [Syntrophomonadaceae bacterium]